MDGTGDVALEPYPGTREGGTWGLLSRSMLGFGEGARDDRMLSCFFNSARFNAAWSGAAYASNGLRYAFDLAFCGALGLKGLGVRSGIGLDTRLAGRKLSSRTSTKFDGNRPIMRLSRLSRPIHHEPSPALRHSIRSPSTNPRSRLDYVRVSK
jgi:hypothetical protein